MILKTIVLLHFIQLIFSFRNSDSNQEHTSSRNLRNLAETLTVSEPNIPTTQPNSSLIIDENLTLGWTFNNDSTIDFFVFWQQNTWFGLGFGGSMINTDMMIAQQNGTVITIQDAWSTGNYQPQIDRQQDFTLLSYTITGNEVDFVFRRKLNTGDTNQDIILVKDENYQFSYAYSDASCIFYSLVKVIQDNSSSLYTTFPIQLSEGIDDSLLQTSEDTPLFLYFHGIILFIAWGVVADIGIFFARYQKTNNNYRNIHAACFIFVVLVTIIIVSFSLQIFGQQDTGSLFLVHQTIAYFLLSFVILQLIFGLTVKYFLDERTKKNRQFALQIRNVHRILGINLFLLAKIQIFIGLYAYGLITLLIIAVIWSFCLLVVLGVFEGIRYKTKNVKAGVLLKKLPLKDDHQALLDLLNNGFSRAEILSKLPSISWVMLNNKVYDITGVQHPGGNFIHESVKGREIARFFFGAYGLEFTTLPPHAHSQKAYQLLQSKYIGEIDTSQSIIIRKGDYKLDEKQTATPFWKKVSQKSLSNTVMKVTFENQDNTIKNYQYGVEWFGKHFTISTQEYGEKTRLYTTVISMSDENEARRNKLLAMYDSQFGQQSESKEILFQDYQEVGESLSFIIKRYQSPNALSAFIHDSKNVQYVINGPFGLGLELKQQSLGSHIAFVGGTGILPFLDLLDFLLQKAIYMAFLQANSLKTQEVDFLNNNLEQSLADGFCLTIFAAFQNEDEFIGAQWIRRLYQISKTHNLNLFDIAIRYSNNTVDPVVTNITGYKINFMKERFDAQFISLNVSKDKAQKVYICGPPKMNRAVPAYLKSNGIEDGKIIII